MKADLAKLRALHEAAFQWPPKNLDAFAEAMHEALPELLAEITHLRAIAEAVERAPVGKVLDNSGFTVVDTGWEHAPEIGQRVRLLAIGEDG